MYRRNGIVLHHGDSLFVVQSFAPDSIDTIICDPPYALPQGFMGKEWDRFDGLDDVALGYWLSGLSDAKGCFQIHPQNNVCSFQIRLSREHRHVLKSVRAYLKCGTVIDDRDGQQSRFIVQDKKGCRRLIDVFRRFPLRTARADIFRHWADAVERQFGRHVDVPLSEMHGAAPWSGNRFQNWVREWAGECLRVAKPGGLLMAFGSPRTFHRLTAGLEDAGWEIRDCMMYMYGTGFPKSHNISKAIDKKLGAERTVIGRYRCVPGLSADKGWNDGPFSRGEVGEITVSNTPLGRLWEGYGTALKPAWEPIIIAMKPVVGNFAGNAIRYGLAGFNIGGCRTETMQDAGIGSSRRDGRWPANIVLDDDAVAVLNRSTDAGCVSRFFYTAKAGQSERGAGNIHPTVKPLSLVRYLCRLTRPPSGGIVLDPFCGSGTTLLAAYLEGRDAIGIELKRKYYRIAKRRLAHEMDKPRLLQPKQLFGERP